jgi:hypothetical protein
MLQDGAGIFPLAAIDEHGKALEVWRMVEAEKFEVA